MAKGERGGKQARALKDAANPKGGGAVRQARGIESRG